MLKDRSFFVSWPFLCAGLFGIILAFGCLTWGVVYDKTTAAYLIVMMLLLVSLNPLHFETSAVIIRRGGLVIASFFVLLLIQKLMPFAFQHHALWQSIATELNQPGAERFIYNQTDWNLAFGRFLFLSLIFFITIKLATSPKGSKRLLQSLLVASVVMVATTFIATSHERIEGEGIFKHGLINDNSAATYLGIMLLVTIWQLHHQLRRMRPHREKLHLFEWIDKLSVWQVGQLLFSLFACLLFLSTLLLTGSKGGILSSFFAAGLLIAILILKKHTRSTTRLSWLYIIGGVTTSAIIVWVISPYGLSFHDELSRSGLVMSERPYIYRASLALIADHPLLGVGLGNFAAIFPLYRLNLHQHATENLINRAHSTYIEVMAETGLIGFMIIAFAIYIYVSIFVRQLIKRHKHYGFPALGLSVITLVGVHSLIDFPMQIPGVAAIVIAILTLCAIQAETYHPTPSRLKAH